MITQTSRSSRNRRVFNSVFGGPSLSQPTPVATPQTQFTSPGQIFGAPVPINPPVSLQQTSSQAQARKLISLNVSDHVEDQVRWDRSWHLVTRTLSVPDYPEQRVALEALKPERETLGEEFYRALDDVLWPGKWVPFARQTEDLVVWHTGQVRQHFLMQVLPVLGRIRGECKERDFVGRGIRVLEMANRLYLHGLSYIKEQMDGVAPKTAEAVVEKFRRDLHSIISNSALDLLSGPLSLVVHDRVFTILGLPANTSQVNDSPVSISPENTWSEQARRELLGLIQSLKNVGLAGERLQVIFAEVMNDTMSEYVHRGYKGVWSPEDIIAKYGEESNRRSSTLPRTANLSSSSRSVAEICEWTENRYAKIAVQVLNIIDGKNTVSWADKEKFKEMAIGRLAELRTHEMFDIVGEWQNSSGALDDLRTAITTTQRRLHLTEVFAETLSQELLNPGASTLQILRTYISMIWSFHALDQSKVLLDRVAYPLQSYLHSREDTVRIIISGLLSDTEDSEGNPILTSKDKLVELAHLLNKGPKAVGKRANDEELDWHDLDWVPDPVDAGPGYKRSKDADIIGTMIGVLGSQDVFIKEFQGIIGENLIRNEGGFEKEIKVLDLLKIRFGESLLQACEVMLRDIQDSIRTDLIIRHTQHMEPPSPSEISSSAHDPDYEDPYNPNEPEIHAKILSRLFWPQLQNETFKVPEEIRELQERYEEGFERLKTARKLAWLDSLGQATVELEFEDRTVTEEVHTYQATVIHAFASEEGSPDPEFTVDQLVSQLQMDEDLVTSALRFWTKKLVLHTPSPSTPLKYTTLPLLSSAQSLLSSSHHLPTSSYQDDTNQDPKDKGWGKEKEELYWSFIQGMLRNGGSQGVGQICMMLKMLIEGGFPYGEGELGAFLQGKVEGGELEGVQGGRFRLKR